MDPSPAGTHLLPEVWSAVHGDARLLEGVTLTGPPRVLPSVFAVTDLAAAAVAAATLAAAELLAVRRGDAVAAVRVDRRAACGAFTSEARFTPQGWTLPSVWDPIAGDYRAGDGWIRLHTNYRAHRDAVLRVLGIPARPEAGRERVAEAVAGWDVEELEAAVVGAGGCAAAMRDGAGWDHHPAGVAAASETLVSSRAAPAAAEGSPDLATGASVTRPLAGVRVLDLTRVIAGPVGTRFLAAYGADVLRIDPPGFEEVPALLPETTVGKRCAFLDLRRAEDRAVFEGLVAQAHVVVSGLRPGALAGLGYDAEALRARRPALVTASLDAYGWSGPWAGRRGFDSLVQMSSGIAAAGAAATGADRPVPLPAQALDHSAGYLLAAAVCRALTSAVTGVGGADVRTSLVACAGLLRGAPDPDGLTAPPPRWDHTDTVATDTAWGPARRVPVPGSIAGVPALWHHPAGPLGRHPASFPP